MTARWTSLTVAAAVISLSGVALGAASPPRPMPSNPLASRSAAGPQDATVAERAPIAQPETSDPEQAPSEEVAVGTAACRSCHLPRAKPDRPNPRERARQAMVSMNGRAPSVGLGLDASKEKPKPGSKR